MLSHQNFEIIVRDEAKLPHMVTADMWKKVRSKQLKKMMFLNRKYFHTGEEGAILPTSQKMPALKQENLPQTVWVCLKK